MSSSQTPVSPARRRFLKATFASALALPASRVLGANEEIRVGVVGVRGRGKGHLDAFSRLSGSRVVAVCDVDPAVLAEQTARVTQAQGIKVDAIEDYRRLLERSDIDAVAIATPNHWHALMGIWACQAGKDVYLEKPISHNVREGRILVQAARKHGRIVQGGTQNRSNPKFQEAVAFGQSGELGKLQRVYGRCFKARSSIGSKGKGQLPKGLNYDLWTGPAEMEPLTRERLHYDWHWVYNTGNGDMGNQGVHQLDIGLWVLGDPGGSRRVFSVGGRLGYVDDAETPNSQFVLHEFDEAPLIFETRGLPRAKEFQDPGAWRGNMDKPLGNPSLSGISLIAEYEKGSIYFDHGRRAAIIDEKGDFVRQFEGDASVSSDHYANFLGAMRSRKVEDLTADCEKTHHSSAMCHTGMISHMIGKKSEPNEIRDRLKGDSLALEGYEQLAEHLGRNGVDLAKTPLTLGPSLAFDPAEERFAGNGELDEAANALLFRVGRGEFRIPEEV